MDIPIFKRNFCTDPGNSSYGILFQQGLEAFGACGGCVYLCSSFSGGDNASEYTISLIALALIGVADSFGIPLLTSYFTDLKDVERFGYDRGLGVYSLFENGAQSLGSFVFGYVLVLGVGRGLSLC
mgnify:CR=1 FL=1